MRVPRHNSRGWTRGTAAVLLAVLTAALVAWLAVIPATRVQAATYTVNVTTDDADLSVGDGNCDSSAAAGSQCSLRAAIEEVNASPGADIIAFSVSGPIVLGAALPAITDNDLVINGGGQQVSMTAPAVAALSVNALRVNINNLVVDGSGIGTNGISASNFSDDLVLDYVTVRNFTFAGFLDVVGGGSQRVIVRNGTFTANGGAGINLSGGADNVIQNNVITNNGAGLGTSFENNLLIQGNTFAGNTAAQIIIADMTGGQSISIIQNNITSNSDGIRVEASPAVDPAASINIGRSFDNRNVFRGTLGGGDQHLRNLSGAAIDAIYNDWDAYNVPAIEAVICHDGDAGCGPGIVDFDPFVTTPSPLPTPTGTPTATVTPGEATVTPTATTGPGEVETVALVAGCNPVAWTGPNATPIATVAGATAPAGILVAIWQFEGGIWLGYSPQFPDVSDLTQMDRLDVAFVCVSSAGTFSRPII